MTFIRRWWLPLGFNVAWLGLCGYAFATNNMAIINIGYIPAMVVSLVLTVGALA